MAVLCRADEVGDDQAKGYAFGEHQLVVVRQDGQLHVYLNWCPHLGIELNFMPDEFFDPDKHYLQCANHGALFQVDDGLCVLGPCKGSSLKKVGFSVVDGEIHVDSIPGRFF